MVKVDYWKLLEIIGLQLGSPISRLAGCTVIVLNYWKFFKKNENRKYFSKIFNNLIIKGDDVNNIFLSTYS